MPALTCMEKPCVALWTTHRHSRFAVPQFGRQPTFIRVRIATCTDGCQRRAGGTEKQLAWDAGFEKEAHGSLAAARLTPRTCWSRGGTFALTSSCSGTAISNTQPATATSKVVRDHTGDRMKTAAERLQLRWVETVMNSSLQLVERYAGRLGTPPWPLNCCESSPGSAGDAAAAP